MHQSVLTWVSQVITPPMIVGNDVLEVGGLNMNGTVRPLITRFGPRTYMSTDMRTGPGVDKVIKAEDLPTEWADVVISTEMLEHAEHWHLAFKGMAEAVRTGGLLIITTRSPGYPKHLAPSDYWRFTTDQMAEALINGCGLSVLEIADDPEAPGVFAMAYRPSPWEAAFPDPAGATPV